MWLLLLLRDCENITDESVAAIANTCGELQVLVLT